MCLLLCVGAPVSAQDSAVEQFFREFTDQWVRRSPDQATANRYFSGAEQDALERQMTPRTSQWDVERVQLAREGVTRSQAFDRSRMSAERRLSADIMRWSLELVAEGDDPLQETRR